MKPPVSLLLSSSPTFHNSDTTELVTMASPSPHDVVVALMTQKPGVLRDTRRKVSGTKRKNVPHHVFACPMNDKCRAGGEIVFPRGMGYSNPYKHLKSCLSDGDESHLMNVYANKIAQNRRHGVFANVKHNEELCVPATSLEKSMYGYLKLVTAMSYPVSHVESPVLRGFSKYDDGFALSYFKETMFKLTELVEKRVGEEMVQYKGAVIHDGWTSNSTHYLGVFVSYMKKVAVLQDGEEHFKEELTMPLISLSPMSKVEMADDCEQENTEATRFDAETHVHQLEDIFRFYNCDVHDWTLCTIGDNCAVNKRISRLLQVPHVGCMSHKLNLEVKAMVKRHHLLRSTIDSVQQTMSDCKRRLRNRAILRNLTRFTPVLMNETRWSGIYTMLKRYNHIRDDLLKVVDTEGATVTMDVSSGFSRQTKRFADMLAEINTVTLELQKYGASLSDCRYAVDTLSEVVTSGRNDEHSLFYGCKLGNSYIQEKSHIATDDTFETGVVKVQRGDISAMTPEEKEACSRLKLSASNSREESCRTNLTMADRIAAKKRHRENNKEEYMNCGFILGSVAEVERLWSVAGNVLANNRSSMTPLLFECLMFLKVNSSYWDINLVSDAMKISRSEKVRKLLSEDAGSE